MIIALLLAEFVVNNIEKFFFLFYDIDGLQQTINENKRLLPISIPFQLLNSCVKYFIRWEFSINFQENSIF